MKKRLAIYILILSIMATCFTGIYFVSAESNVWSGEGVTITNQTNYTIINNNTNEEKSITYSEKIDFNLGAKLEVIFVNSSDFAVNLSSRINDTNFVKMIALNDEGKGVEIKAYGLYLNGEVQPNKMVYDVTYINGDLRDYVESVETYSNVHAKKHVFQIRKELGFLFVSFDGLTAIPVDEFADLDLSQATVSISTKSEGNDTNYRVYPFSNTELQSFISDSEWGTMGSTVVTKNNDGTTTYDIKDKRMIQYNGFETRVRENIINLKGYDVNKPIILEVEYEIVSTMSVWWAVALSKSPYENISKITYYEEDTIIDDETFLKGDLKTDISSDNMETDNGIMFQTVTGNAQPSIEQELIVPYVTRAGAGGYNSRLNLDTIEIVIGEEGTTWKYNGTTIYENIGFKKSDFPNEIVYPYFHFIGTPANPNKENKIILKGINAPKLAESKDYKYILNSQKNVDVKIENYNNIKGELTLYKDGLYIQEISSDNFDYDIESKILSINYSAFENAPEGITKVYAKNDSGSEEISILIIDETNVTQPPEVEKDTYYYIKDEDTQDLSINVDIKNGTFLKLTGSGISSSKYTFTPNTDSTVGVLTISKDYLKGKDIGNLKFIIQTTNIYQEVFEDLFYIDVVYELPNENNNNNTNNNETSEGGCRANVQDICFSTSLIFAVFILLSGIIRLKKKSLNK